MKKLTIRIMALLLSLTLMLPMAAGAAGPQGTLSEGSPTGQEQTGTGQDSTAAPGGTETDPQDPVEDPAGGDPTDAPEDGAPSETPEDGQKPEGPAGEETPGTDEGKPAESVTVTFLDGDEELLQVEVATVEDLAQIPTEDAEGNPILGWVMNGRRVTTLSLADLTEDCEVSVWDAPSLTQAHEAYLNGKGEARFGSLDSLTRAEATAMICNLLADKTPGTFETAFTDVNPGDWYYEPITTMASLGVVAGYENGTFLPDALISRSTFVYMLGSLFPLEEVQENPFTDLPDNHWAKDYVLSAYEKGWLKGYPDGKVHPDGTISRSEAVTLLNAVMGRTPSAQTTEQLKAAGACLFTDVRPTDWYYSQVMEACLPHTPIAGDGEENWTGVQLVSCGYEPGVRKIRGVYYAISENRQITFQTPGFQTINGKLYYVADNGTIPALYVGLVEFEGGLRCVNSDGSFLTDGYVGYLYFDRNGLYTSGNAEVDAEVEKAMALCIKPGMTREEKLRAAYIYVRDNCVYLSRAHHARGSTDWYAEGALIMFQKHKGNCYCYTGAFLYMARRLGYQAYGISGGYRKDNTDHAWVMIDGYIYDPCLEYLYPVRSHKYYDLYRVDPNHSPLIYFFP